MKRRFMEKGVEQGLWKAESFRSEGEDTVGPIQGRGLRIPFMDTVDTLRSDPVTLGSLCLALTSGAASLTVSDSVLQPKLKSGMLWGSVALGSFALGRLTRNGDLEAQAESFAVERRQMEQVLDMMEHDQQEKEEQARESERRNFFDVGGGILNAFHTTMGPSLTSSNNAYTTRAHGQDPFSQHR